MEFTIKTIIASTHDSSFGGYPFKVSVNIEIDQKVWAKYKKQSNLGQLYGIDIGNAVYAINNNIPALNPSVDDRKRSSNGVKIINLTYYMANNERTAISAKELGLKVNVDKSGHVFGGFSDYVKIYEHKAKANLKLVS